MPIKHAAFKSVRQDKKRHLRNLRITSELHTLSKKCDTAFAAGKTAEAAAVVRVFSSKLAKAVSKGVIPKNRASRKISRLMTRLKRSERGR